MDIRAYLETAIFPRVRGDGGWLEISRTEQNRVYLTARGECAQCACEPRCEEWIRGCVKRDLDTDVELIVERKPFIWRT